MASRACPNPVQAVARAARLRTLRNTLVAVTAVLATALGRMHERRARRR